MLDPLISIPTPASLVRALAEHWDLPEATATLIKHSLGLTYRIDTQRGVFACRLSGGFDENARVISHRLGRLQADLLDHGAPVPTAIPNKTGAFTVDIKSHEGVRVASLLHWVEGKAVAERRNLPSAQKIGQALAAFHAAADRLSLETKIEKHWPSYHLDLSASELAACAPDLDLDAFQAVLDQLNAELDRASRAGKNACGLIHGDLDSSNAVLDGDGSVYLLDLECCGIGPRVVDLAAFTIETRFWAWPAAERARSAFFDGYFGHGPNAFLTRTDIENRLPLFEAARLVQVLRRHLDLRARHGVGKLSPAFAHRITEGIRALTKSG